jgi:hypothetical protein
MTTFNNISINSNGCACRPGKALTKVDWANIYLAYLDIIDVNAGQSVVSRKSVRQRGSRAPLIGTYNHFEHLLSFFHSSLTRYVYNTILSLDASTLVISSCVFEKRLIPLLLPCCTLKRSQLHRLHELHCSPPRGELPHFIFVPL